MQQANASLGWPHWKKIKLFAKEDKIIEKENNPNIPKKLVQEAKNMHHMVKVRPQDSLEQDKVSISIDIRINTFTYRN